MSSGAAHPGDRGLALARGMIGRGPHGMIGQGVKAKDARTTLRRLWKYLSAHRGGLIAVTLLVAATTALGLLTPYLLGRAIDLHIARRDVHGLAVAAALMAAVVLSGALTTWLQTYLMVGVSQRTVRSLRRDLFGKLQCLPLHFFDSRPHGEIMSRLANDVENVSNVLAQGVTQLIAGVLSSVGVAIVMLVLNPLLAVVGLLAIPLMVLITGLVSARTRSRFRVQQQTLGALNGVIEETVTGQRVVKAFGREEQAIASFEEANRRFRQAAVGAQVLSLILAPLTNFVNNLGFALVAGVGGWMVVRGLSTVGTVAAFINYSRQFARPLSDIANLYNTLQSAIAGAERVFEVLEEPAELDDPPHPEARPLGRLSGHVELRQVSFGYRPGVPVLREISLEALPGQTIALVGPTGAGKTTIVNLLTRFYDIDSGAILLDGRDIRSLPRGQLRRQLGVVLQETFLFSLSALENIRYGRLEATDAEVIAASELANADSFIRHLPEGYQTVLSEEGANLSQGQRQLLAIARAALSDPAVLILDEATSSVDTRTEAHIQEAMLRLMKDRTSFVIAHRLSTIRNADQILVLDQGRIVERGTHRELLAHRGFYYSLYLSQFRGQAPPEEVQ